MSTYKEKKQKFEEEKLKLFLEEILNTDKQSDNTNEFVSNLDDEQKKFLSKILSVEGATKLFELYERHDNFVQQILPFLSNYEETINKIDHAINLGGNIPRIETTAASPQPNQGILHNVQDKIFDFNGQKRKKKDEEVQLKKQNEAAEVKNKISSYNESLQGLEFGGEFIINDQNEIMDKLQKIIKKRKDYVSEFTGYRNEFKELMKEDKFYTRRTIFKNKTDAKNDYEKACELLRLTPPRHNKHDEQIKHGVIERDIYDNRTLDDAGDRLVRKYTKEDVLGRKQFLELGESGYVDFTHVIDRDNEVIKKVPYLGSWDGIYATTTEANKNKGDLEKSNRMKPDPFLTRPLSRSSLYPGGNCRVNKRKKRTSENVRVSRILNKSYRRKKNRRSTLRRKNERVSR